MLEAYSIAGCTNFDPHPCFTKEATYPNFQLELQKFKQTVTGLLGRGEPSSFMKIGDGDLLFLLGKQVGSAKAGVRAISKPVSYLKRRSFLEKANQVDYLMCEIYPENQRKFRRVFPGKRPDFPAEYVYGLVANKWLLTGHGGKVGLIGAREKLEVIKDLTALPEYSQYLGVQGFSDYIHLPQKFAADEPDAVLEQIRDDLKNSTADIFLMGMGHAKSWIIPELKAIKESIYIDVGSGIDALAGMIDSQRPYFGDWQNFRFSDDTRYVGIDYLQFNFKNIHYVG